MFKSIQQPKVVIKKIYQKYSGKEAKRKAMLYLNEVVKKPLQMFCPNSAQELFIKTVVDSTKDTDVPVINCTFGNGVGKSTIVMHLIANIIYKPLNDWFDFSIFRNWKYPKIIWYVTNPAALGRKMEELLELLKKYDKNVKEFKDGKNYIHRIKAKDFLIFGLSYEQDAKEFESESVGMIVNDEPCPEQIWKAEKSRRRLGCITINVMTPLYVDPYLLDEYNQAQKEGRNTHFHISADVYQACEERGVRGHLPAKVIDDMIADYDADERDARIYGKFTYFSQLIFPELKSDIHFVNPDEYPLQSNYLYYVSINPHEGRPTPTIFCAITPQNRYIIFDELPDDKSKHFWNMKEKPTIENVANEIKHKEKVYNISPTRIMDRYFGRQTRGGYGKNFLQEYDNNGLTFQESYEARDVKSEVEFGHQKIRQALQYMPDGKPGLVIYHNCYHTWDALSHYIRKHETTKASADKPTQSGKIVEKYKFFVDCIRYFVCVNVSHREKVKYTYTSQKNVFATIGK